MLFNFYRSFLLERAIFTEEQITERRKRESFAAFCYSTAVPETFGFLDFNAVLCGVAQR